jgi:hypothetical protein
MIITLIKNNVELILCDGAVRGVDKSAGPRGLTYTGQEQRQVAQFLRAKTARVFPRGNGLDGTRGGIPFGHITRPIDAFDHRPAYYSVL